MVHQDKIGISNFFWYVLLDGLRTTYSLALHTHALSALLHRKLGFATVHTQSVLQGFPK